MKFNRLLTSLIFSTNCSVVFAIEPILPPMVNIPAGEFQMGSDNGDLSARPKHKVVVDEFQMAKYQVTVSEYKRFIDDSGYTPAQNCNDLISSTWLASPAYKEGVGRFDQHRYSYSEYQPAVCLSRQDIQAYISWLNQKTEQQYRLPTEQEWEYALKANTTSRYFWGDDDDLTQVCRYGNVADQYDEAISSSRYGASYVGFLEHANCNDGEAFTAIVGLYRANPFGLYDMVGNASHYLSTCYKSGYGTRTKVEMDTSQCKIMAHRSTSWHNLPSPAASRGVNFQFDWQPTALAGFRLVKSGHSETLHTSTEKFEKKLKRAQKQHQQARIKLPDTPSHVFLNQVEKQSYQLNWRPVNNHKVTGYEVYQSNTPYAHLLGKYFKNHYAKLATVDAGSHSLMVNLPEDGASYKVVALTEKLASLPSEAAVSKKIKTLQIPGRIEMQETAALENVKLNYRAKTADKPELYYLSKPTPGWRQPLVASTFYIEVEESGWYRLNYNGFTRKQGVFFQLWQNNQLAAEIDYDANIKDSESERHQVYLEQGQHQLQVNIKREGRDFWMLGWLEFSKIKQK